MLISQYGNGGDLRSAETGEARLGAAPHSSCAVSPYGEGNKGEGL